MLNQNTKNEKPITNDEVTVLIRGFPPNTDLQKIREYLNSICEEGTFKLSKKKCQFHGYAFVYFQTIEQAQAFSKKKFHYDNLLLECKFPVDRVKHIKQCIEDLRKPRKVFADKIPKNLHHNDVKSIFSGFGKVQSLVLLESHGKPINQAMVTFAEHDHANKCVMKHNIKLSGNVSINVFYAQPKFSEYMLLGVDNRLRAYIRDVQRRKKDYNPVEFRELYDKYFNVLPKSKKNQKGNTKCQMKAYGDDKADHIELDGFSHFGQEFKNGFENQYLISNDVQELDQILNQQNALLDQNQLQNYYYMENQHFNQQNYTPNHIKNQDQMICKDSQESENFYGYPPYSYQNNGYQAHYEIVQPEEFNKCEEVANEEVYEFRTCDDVHEKTTSPKSNSSSTHEDINKNDPNTDRTEDQIARDVELSKVKIDKCKSVHTDSCVESSPEHKQPKIDPTWNNVLKPDSGNLNYTDYERHHQQQPYAANYYVSPNDQKLHEGQDNNPVNFQASTCYDYNYNTHSDYSQKQECMKETDYNFQTEYNNNYDYKNQQHQTYNYNYENHPTETAYYEDQNQVYMNQYHNVQVNSQVQTYVNDNSHQQNQYIKSEEKMNNNFYYYTEQYTQTSMRQQDYSNQNYSQQGGYNYNNRQNCQETHNAYKVNNDSGYTVPKP